MFFSGESLYAAEAEAHRWVRMTAHACTTIDRVSYSAVREAIAGHHEITLRYYNIP